MKLKVLMKLTALVSVIAVATSSVGYAYALRVDPKIKVYKPEGRRSNDIVYEDFTDTVLDGATVYTTEYEVGSNYEKNCMVLNDEDHSSSGADDAVKSFSYGNMTGLLGMEIRFKYNTVPDTTSTYATIRMDWYGSNSEIVSRLAVGSGDGVIHFNYGSSTGQQAMDNKAKIADDTWYTAKWIVDFNAREIDFSLLNETTGVTTTALVRGFYQAETTDVINRLRLSTLTYGGKYIFDYIRVSKESDRMEEVEDPNLVKGMPVEKIPNPVAEYEENKINITVDGVFKFPSAKPYMTDAGDVMISAKNLASFVGASYTRFGDIYTIAKGYKVLRLDVANKTSKLNSATASVKTMEKSGVQLFVSVSEFCKAMGYDCTIEHNWVKLLTGKIDAEKGGTK